MRNCFVPYCDALCKGEKRRMMFNAPRNPQLFEIWKNILPKQREFKLVDKVCSRHFREEDIIKTFDSIIQGELVQLERDRPKLRNNAYPCLNLDVERPQKFRERKRRPIRKRNEVDEQELENGGAMNIHTVSDGLNIKWTIEKDPSRMNAVQKDTNDVEMDNRAAKSQDDQKNSELPLENNVEVIGRDVEENLVEDDFNTLYDEVFEVVLPSTLWGTHRDNERTCIAFTYFEPQIATTAKSVILSKNGNLKIKIRNRQIAERSIKEDISATHLTNVLNEVNEMNICKNYHKNVKICSVVALDGSTFCENCSK